MPKIQKPYVKLNEDYIQSQTKTLSAQITDLEDKLMNVKAEPQGTAERDTAVQLMKLIRERKQYLSEFCKTRHNWFKRSTPPKDPRKQYQRSYM